MTTLELTKEELSLLAMVAFRHLNERTANDILGRHCGVTDWDKAVSIRDSLFSKISQEIGETA